jgi:hypothetical protein
MGFLDIVSGDIKTTKEFNMKIKLFSVMLVCLLALSFGFVSCGGDDDSGGGNVPTELVGKWYSDAEKMYLAFQIYANGGVDDDEDKPNETFGTITLKSGTGTSGVFSYRHNLLGNTADVTFTIASNVLSISVVDIPDSDTGVPFNAPSTYYK